jgi:hypothetical protein
VADQVAAMTRPLDHKQVLDRDECSVCLSGMTVKNSRVTPCGHVFHETCLIDWLTESVTCPMCRHVVRRANDDKITWAEMVGNEILLTQRQQQQEFRVRFNGMLAAIERQDNEQLLQLQLQPLNNWWRQMMPRLLPQRPVQMQQRNAPLAANAPEPFAQAHGVVADEVPYALH